MPVHFRPDELDALPAQSDEDDGEQEAAGLSAAEVWTVARPCLLWLLVAAIPLIAGLTLLKPTLLAMERIRLIGDDSRALTPLLFFLLFGGCFGAFLASRLSLGDTLIWVASGAAALLLAIIGGVYAITLFDGRVPSTCLVALGVMVVSAIGGAVFHTKWSN